MKWKYEIFTILGIALLFAIPLILFAVFDTNHSNAPEQPSQEQPSNENQNTIVWGVDSASYTDQNMYTCVVENFGQPKVWGRYLGDNEDVSIGLDSNEVKYLHKNNVKILVIYNHVNDARGYDHGVQHAKNAVQLATQLGIPKNVALFVDIEPKYPVDAKFLEGWYDQLSETKYEAGVYGVFDKESDIITAFNNMPKKAQQNTIVWTAFPQEQITTQNNAPKYNPQGPKNAKLYGWQYAIEAKTCNIDTNLFKEEMLDYLW